MLFIIVFGTLSLRRLHNEDDWTYVPADGQGGRRRDINLDWWRVLRRRCPQPTHSLWHFETVRNTIDTDTTTIVMHWRHNNIEQVAAAAPQFIVKSA